MAAGPTKGQVRYHMKKAQDQAKAYENKNQVTCNPRLLRASNGEACIVYDVTDRRGNKQTLISLTEVK